MRARVDGETERFLYRATGSTIDAEGLRCYQTLFGNSQHCSGALKMMAGWDLASLKRRFPSIANPVLLIHSTGDKAVPVAQIEQAAALLPNAAARILPGRGHLAHEEDPQCAGKTIIDFLMGEGEHR